MANFRLCVSPRGGLYADTSTYFYVSSPTMAQKWWCDVESVLDLAFPVKPALANWPPGPQAPSSPSPASAVLLGCTFKSIHWGCFRATRAERKGCDRPYGSRSLKYFLSGPLKFAGLWGKQCLSLSMLVQKASPLLLQGNVLFHFMAAPSFLSPSPPTGCFDHFWPFAATNNAAVNNLLDLPRFPQVWIYW